MKFSEFIKKEREKKGISQEKLAEMISVSKSTIYNWENNRNLPDIKDKVLELLSKEFDETIKNIRTFIVDSLSNETPSISKEKNLDFLPEAISNFYITEEEVKLIKMQAIQEELKKGYNSSDITLSGRLEGYYSEGNIKVTENFSKDFNPNISIKELVDIFGNEQTVIETIKSLKLKINIIPANILADILFKNSLNSLSIRTLNNKDIAKIIKASYPITIQKIIEAYNDEVFVLSNEKCFSYKDYSKENNVSWKEILSCTEKYTYPQYEIKDNYLYLANSWGDCNKKSNLKLFNYNKKFFMEYYQFENYEEYQKEKLQYEEKLKSWQESMTRFEELKKIYEFSDDKKALTEPKPPTPPQKPKAYRKLALTQKGEELYQFLMDNDEELNPPIKKEEAYIPSRLSLEKYLGQDIKVRAFLADITDKSLLFKDIYKENEYICDHMHQFLNKDNALDISNIETGKYYNLYGTVKTYKKDEGKIDYHIDINKIE